jgi:hypothetical protein
MSTTKVIQFSRSEIYAPAYNSWPDDMRKQAERDAATIRSQIQMWLDENTDIEIIAMSHSGEGYEQTAIIIYKTTN